VVSLLFNYFGLKLDLVYKKIKREPKQKIKPQLQPGIKNLQKICRSA
jgi:hypothetical protein